MSDELELNDRVALILGRAIIRAEALALELVLLRAEPPALEKNGQDPEPSPTTRVS